MKKLLIIIANMLIMGIFLFFTLCVILGVYLSLGYFGAITVFAFILYVTIHLITD